MNKHKPEIHQIATVPCCHSETGTHRIAVTRDWQYILLDHPEGIASVKLLDQIRQGGEPSCASHVTGKLPDGRSFLTYNRSVPNVRARRDTTLNPFKAERRYGSYAEHLTGKMRRALPVSLPFDGPHGRITSGLEWRWTSQRWRERNGYRRHDTFAWRDGAPSRTSGGGLVIYYTTHQFCSLVPYHRWLSRTRGVEIASSTNGSEHVTFVTSDGSGVWSAYQEKPTKDTPYFIPYEVHHFNSETGVFIASILLINPNHPSPAHRYYQASCSGSVLTGRFLLTNLTDLASFLGD